MSYGERKAFPTDFPEGLKPRLRLFFSVDIVGSTPLKQSLQPWRPTILNFYRDFDHTVHSAFSRINGNSNNGIPTPEFWKSNGDELLYTCQLERLDQAHETINTWLGVLHQYRASMASHPERLDVKSTAWVGLFPVPNAEVFFRRDRARFASDLLDDPQLLQAELRDEWYADRGRGDITRDFVGPSIDTGFRLTSWATQRRFVISVDLAFLLTSSCSEVEEPLPVHYSGRQKLKGVIDDEPYPVLWIPVGGRNKPADAAIGRDLAGVEAVRASCEAVIEQHYRFITPLFLSDADAQDFDWSPPYIINEIRRLWTEELRRKADADRDADSTMAYISGRSRSGGVGARARRRRLFPETTSLALRPIDGFDAGIGAERGGNVGQVARIVDVDVEIDVEKVGLAMVHP